MWDSVADIFASIPHNQPKQLAKAKCLVSGYVRLAIDLLTGKIPRHSTQAGWHSIPAQRLSSDIPKAEPYCLEFSIRGSRFGFRHINDRLQWIARTEYWSIGNETNKGVTKAIRLTEHGLAALADLHNSTAPPQVKIPRQRAVKSYGRTDIHPANAFTQPTLKLPASNVERCRRTGPEGEILASIIESHPRGRNQGREASYTMPNHYRETRTGRLFQNNTRESINLQTLRRHLRASLFHGWHSIDINNCHMTIRLAVAEKAGIATPSLRHYVEDKEAVRKWLNSMGPNCDAKTALIALTYGAELTTHPKRAIGRCMGESASQFCKLPWVNAFREELARVDQHLVKHWKAIAPYLRRPPELSHGTNARAAHILQGIESRALTAILEASCIAAGNQPIQALLLHDGVVTPLSPAILGIEGTIFRETGVPMRISHASLKSPDAKT